ncbi:hypothetical protein CW304_30675 [Bacillus sp. UFRGS-B20]|nr:hypothetical protein CW304_30675 [Bacillus sp. UFRGS-B20]
MQSHQYFRCNSLGEVAGSGIPKKAKTRCEIIVICDVILLGGGFAVFLYMLCCGFLYKHIGKMD